MLSFKKNWAPNDIIEYQPPTPCVYTILATRHGDDDDNNDNDDDDDSNDNGNDDGSDDGNDDSENDVAMAWRRRKNEKKIHSLTILDKNRASARIGTSQQNINRERFGKLKSSSKAASSA